jgi:hypothetical protein
LDSDCPSGTGCNYEYDYTFCLPTCEPEAGACAIGTCRQAQEGYLCDPRGATGPCASNEQCLTDLCMPASGGASPDGGESADGGVSAAGECAPVASLGQPCTGNAQCATGQCGSKATPDVCVQNFGGACTSNAECGAGLCCTAGPDASTCLLSPGFFGSYECN